MRFQLTWHSSNFAAILLALVLLLVSADVVAAARNELSSGERACMTEALYYEARDQGVEGMQAVCNVILNRAVKNKMNVCSVIRQRGQFSYRNQRLSGMRDDGALADVRKAIARCISNSDNTNGAQYYCNPDVAKQYRTETKRSKTKKKRSGGNSWCFKSYSLRIGDHVFFKKVGYVLDEESGEWAWHDCDPQDQAAGLCEPPEENQFFFSDQLSDGVITPEELQKRPDTQEI